jgi:endonuclease/exonuclease/phosphatase family metal-dependent hydrolase
VHLRFVSWNINGFAEHRQVAFLAAQRWDICAIQEATTASALEALAEAVGASSYVSARPLLASSDDRQPRYVSALLARSPWTITDAVVLDVPSPERALHALARSGGVAVTVASMALPPASSRAWGPAGKVAQADGIAAWLVGLSGPVLVGIDANTPKVDHPDLARSCWWNDGEERLLGVERIHRLRDAYREVVDGDDVLRAAIVAARPDGPLAVSFRRGRGAGATDCRYDSILASPEFTIDDAGYEYEASVAAGSDHGLVWTELELPE